MSGFTTGAAMSVGLSQISNAFGFSPSSGNYVLHYEEMMWYVNNWYGVITPAQSVVNAGRSYTNHFAIAVSTCF
jgi:hypothetical protein